MPKVAQFHEWIFAAGQSSESVFPRRGSRIAGRALRILERFHSPRSTCMGGIVAAKPLLGTPEQTLYGRLVRAFPGHIILSQVALSRLLVVDQADSAAAGQAIANRFRQLVADFVVCRSDFTALAVVELHGAKASDAERERDRRKDQFLHSAGVKVIRLSANDIPPGPALKALVTTLPLNSSTSQAARRAS